MVRLDYRFAFLVMVTLPWVAQSAADSDRDWSDGTNRWQQTTLSAEVLVPSLQSASEYLMRHQLEDGSFVYIKDPLGTSTKQKKKDAYSLIRHLGGVYALLRAHESTHDPNLLAGAKRGIDFVRRFRDTGLNGPVVRGLKGKLSLGENGFLLINQVLYDQMTQTRSFEAESTELAKFLKKNLIYGGPMMTDGQWAEHQALIGLAHYYLLQTKDPEIVAVARRFITAMIADQRYSHWSVQGQYFYGKMIDFKDEASNAYAYQSAEKLLEDVPSAMTSGVKSRLIGARRQKLYSCNATARNEGLIAAHHIAQATGDQERAKFFLARAQEHIAFAMQFQYGTRGNFYFEDPKMARIGFLFNMAGGVFDNPDDGYVRIDYVSHHVRAIAAYLNSPQVPRTTGLKWKDLEPYGPPSPTVAH